MVNNPREERASLLSASLSVHLHFSQMKPAVFTAQSAFVVSLQEKDLT